MNSKTLLNHMPEYYAKSNLTKNIFTAISNEFNRFKSDCEETQNELKIYTANKTLEDYETDFVLQVNNNYQADFRINKIISKLRGQGIITVDRIKDIAESFSNGEVEVDKDPAKFMLIIIFTGTRGVPPNIQDLKDVINSLKAADWSVDYKFTYLIWNERDIYNLSWDEWSNLNLTWDEYAVYEGKGNNNG